MNARNTTERKVYDITLEDGSVQRINCHNIDITAWGGNCV